MCILLKLDYAQFGVSNLFLSNVIEEKPLEGSARTPPPPPPLGTGRVKSQTVIILMVHVIITVFSCLSNR